MKQAAFDLGKISADRLCSLDFLQLQEAEIYSLKLCQLGRFTVKTPQEAEGQEGCLSNHPGRPHGKLDTSSGSMRDPLLSH